MLSRIHILHICLLIYRIYSIYTFLAYIYIYIYILCSKVYMFLLYICSRFRSFTFGLVSTAASSSQCFPFLIVVRSRIRRKKMDPDQNFQRFLRKKMRFFVRFLSFPFLIVARIRICRTNFDPDQNFQRSRICNDSFNQLNPIHITGSIRIRNVLSCLLPFL